MAVELLRETVFDLPRMGWEYNLRSAESRSHLKPNKNGILEAAGPLKDELNLALFREKEIGQKRIVRVFHGSLHLENFGKEMKTYTKIGYAEECSTDSEPEGETKPALVITRVSKGFHTEDFADGAEELFAYDRRLLKIPRRLRGWLSAAGLFTGSVTGLTAGMGLTGDNISTGVFGLAGGATGIAGADYLEKREQWDLEQRAPFLDEYFCNERGLERLEDVLSHIKTVQFVKAIDAVLKEEGFRLQPDFIRYLWRANIDLACLIDNYNFIDVADGDRNVQGDLFPKMVEVLKENSQNTNTSL